MNQIYWSPSTQEHNVTVLKMSEESVMNQLLNSILKLPFPPGIKNYRNNPSMELKEVVRDSNRKLTKTDLHFALHTNAGGGRGVEAFYDPQKPKTKVLAEKVCSELSKIMGIPNRGAKDGVAAKLLEIRGVKANPVLVEICFHDYLKDMRELQEHWQQVAKTLRDLTVGFFHV